MGFIEALEAERQRLQKQVDELHKQRDQIDDELSKISAEIRAMDAYQAAKEGKPKAAKKRGPRKSGVRQSVLNIISSNPNGISRAGIIDLLGLKDDTKGHQSVSNALQALKKEALVTSEKGVYTVKR